MRFDGRQFGYLMPPRFSLRRYLPALSGEAAIAVAATVRQQIDDMIEAIRRRQSAPVTTMARLSTGLTPTLPFLPAPGALLTS
jgi:hypothetical protein